MASRQILARRCSLAFPRSVVQPQTFSAQPCALRTAHALALAPSRVAMPVVTVPGSFAGNQFVQCRLFSSSWDTLPADEREFIDEAFDLFDHNADGVLTWSELEMAYVHKRAGSALARLFSMHGLATKGLTYELLDEMDLIHAYQNGQIEVVNDKVSREAFVSWVHGWITRYNAHAGDNLDGAQAEHE